MFEIQGNPGIAFFGLRPHQEDGPRRALKWGPQIPFMRELHYDFLQLRKVIARTVFSVAEIFTSMFGPQIPSMRRLH